MMIKSVLGAVAAVALMAGAAQADTNVNTDGDMLVLTTQQLEHVTAAGHKKVKIVHKTDDFKKHGKKDRGKKIVHKTDDKTDDFKKHDRKDRHKKVGDKTDDKTDDFKKHDRKDRHKKVGDKTDDIKKKHLLKHVKGAQATADAVADAQGPRKAVAETFTYTDASTVVDVHKGTVVNTATAISSSSSLAK
jgi:opacity protein-like surface antigen